MAYGGTELDIAASTIDEWMNAGTNGIDWFSSHNPFFAVLIDNSFEPGGDYQFMVDESAEGGNYFKFGGFGNANATVAGVTRANQINAITPTVPGAGGAPSVATTAKWLWAHYQGCVFDNYNDRTKNVGASGKISLRGMLEDQIAATFFDTVGTHLLDDADGTEDKVQSANFCLHNTGTVGTIDQSDGTNNAWWQAVTDADAAVINFQDFDKAAADSTHDTARTTGVRNSYPDIAFCRNDGWSKLLQDAKQAQRTDVQTMVRGGARYIEMSGVRYYHTNRLVADTAILLNSTTWTFRRKTNMPDPVTPGFVPHSGTPSIMEHGYNWLVGFGGASMKHNAILTNKRAS